ncbi:hypothetical protein RSAG8_07960, partial [Rhizoctonia solani AG-8 WAC10335]
MIRKSVMQIAREQARKSKKTVDSVLGLDRVVCNCAKCKGQKFHPQATVDKHMLLYPPLDSNGESMPQASPSRLLPNPPLNQEPNLLPMDFDYAVSRALSPAMSEHSMAPLDNPVAANVQHIAQPARDLDPLVQAVQIRRYRSRAAEFAPAEPFELEQAPSRSPSPALVHCREACTLRPPSPETMIDDFLFDNWLDPPQFRPTSPVSSEYDPSATPLPATPLCNTPEPEEMVQEVDPEENRRFFADLYSYARSDVDDDEDSQFGFGHENLDGGEDMEDMGDVGDVGDECLEDEERDEGNGGDEQDVEGNDGEELAPNAQANPGEPPIQDLGDDDDDPDEEEPAAAFREHPILRNIYLRTYVDLAFHHATKEQIRKTLLSHKLALEAAAQVGELPPGLLEGLLKMPLSVRSLERRLGMDTTRLIRIYTFCEECGTRYSPEQIRSAPHPRCTYTIADIECNTPLYTELTLCDGTQKRNPIKSCPYIPFHGSLERLLRRPGMKELMQTWRGDNPENRARDAPQEEWWRIPIGLTRDEFPEEDGGGYGDYLPEHLVALVSKLLGLSFSINADGYQTFSNGNYSTMGVYITINNLPIYLRTLIENMLLVIVIPGPNEPTAYEFDQMMEPLIEDLIALAQGVRLNVYDKAEERPKSEMVYGHLSLGILDHIARLKRRCYLSVAEGFKLRDNELRDPLDRLDDKYRWLNAPTAAAREQLRQETGVTFTAFDRLPGWYGASNCPIDAMHLFDLGITKYLCQNVLLKPGLLHPLRSHQPFHEQPASKFDAFVARTQFPSFCQRKPPRFLNMTSGIKAEQWRHIAIILPAALFEAWRDGDHMPNTLIPRGGRNTKIRKFQEAQAKTLLQNRRLVHRDQGGRPQDDPKPLSCVAIRNRRLLYATTCRYLLARSTMVRYKVTRDEVTIAQRLLQRFGRELARMNYPVTPNVHTALHLEEGMLQYGSLYGFHTAPFERANRVLINVNNNGHTGGGVEASMARGWLKRTSCHALVREMQGVENPSRDDTATIEMMLSAMRDGPEHERQRGRLDAILAGEDVFQSQAIVRLATTSAEVDWHKDGHRAYWELVADHCSQQLPGVVVYPYGQPPEGGICLTHKHSTRSLPHVHVNGIRYGTDSHRWAYNSRYAYIDPQRHPVLIKRIYRATLPLYSDFSLLYTNQGFLGMNGAYFVTFILSYSLQVHSWGAHLEIAAWMFEELGEAEVINITRFSGAFALSDIQMSTGHYWLTFAMQPIEPEMFVGGVHLTSNRCVHIPGCYIPF